MASSTPTTVTVKIEPNPTSIQSDIIGPATARNAGVMTAAQAQKLDGVSPGAAVASVTGTAPIHSSGGQNPDISIETQAVVPDQSGHAGEFLTTNGTTSSWAPVPPGPPGPAGAGAVLFWGNNDLSPSTTTRFLTPGYDPTGLAPTSAVELVAPRAGTLRNLFVRHNVANGNGNPIVYTVFVNGVATAITTSRVTGAVGTSSDTANSVAVAQGARVSIRVTKAAGVVNGMVQATATLEIG